MTNYIITDTFVTTVGNALTMTDYFDFAYVAPGATLGSTALGGRGILGSDNSQRVQVGGSVVGTVGVDLNNYGDVLVLMGGTIVGSSTGVQLGGGGAVTNAGTLSGFTAISGFGTLSVNNSGAIIAQYNAIHSEADLTLVNTGQILSGAGIYVGGTANISNFGTIRGGLYTYTGNDSFINQGLLVGSIYTGGGNDVFDNTGGRTTAIVDLAPGDDVFIGGGFADLVLGGEGQDDLAGGGGDDRFYAISIDGNDDIDGGNGNDSYDGSNVTLAMNVNLTTGLARIGGATDTLAGIENVWGGSAKDRLTGDAGDNRLIGNDGADSLAALGGNDRLHGGIGTDLLQGGDGNDRLNGNEGRDTLDGGAGNDVLIGSYDVDMFTGGAGDDRFVWTDFEEFIAGTGGLERITDFTQGQDQIDLSSIDALFTATGDQAFRFIGTTAISDYGQISYRTTANATIIAIGFNTPTAFEVIKLDGIIALTAADFVL